MIDSTPILSPTGIEAMHTEALQKRATSASEVVQRAIVNYPGAALAVSATIGVLLACLVKRR